jgi:hypothetical protein
MQEGFQYSTSANPKTDRKEYERQLKILNKVKQKREKDIEFIKRVYDENF